MTTPLLWTETTLLAEVTILTKKVMLRRTFSFYCNGMLILMSCIHWWTNYIIFGSTSGTNFPACTWYWRLTKHFYLFAEILIIVWFNLMFRNFYHTAIEFPNLERWLLIPSHMLNIHHPICGGVTHVAKAHAPNTPPVRGRERFFKMSRMHWRTRQ